MFTDMHFRYEDYLPTLPSEIVTELLRIVQESSNDVIQTYCSESALQLNSVDAKLLENIKNFTHDTAISLGYPMDTASKYFTNPAQFDFLEVSDIVKEWVYKNISPSPVYISIQSMFGGTTITPHIDEARSYAYNYVISDAGGITSFYQPTKEFSHLIAYPQTIFTYDRLELIQEILIKPNRWHYLNVSKIHGVRNIQPGQKRISLSLSYD